jgi:hypothetical protein
MDLLQLRAMGLVNSNPLVKREITIKYFPLKPEDTWASPVVPERESDAIDGKLDFWIRKFTAADSLALAAAKTFDERAYLAIQRGVFNEQGEPIFTSYEVACEVDLTMFAPLLEAVFSLNGIKGKKSRPTTNSGVSSASSSGSPASQRSRKRSRRKS